MPTTHDTSPELPESIADERQLDELLSRPSPAVVEMFGRLEGGVIVLGAAGKMGPTLVRQAVRAAKSAGKGTQVLAASRFLEPAARRALEACGCRTFACDLLDRRAVARLPRAGNVLFLAGRKFGTVGEEALTWAMNTLVPAHVAEHFAGSRIVAFSTGCVYPLVRPAVGGCTEATPPAPVGEYAQSCLGRERVFEHFSRTRGTPVCLFRLNYAAECRYGVVHDLALSILAGRPVSLSAPAFNVIWQADACGWALRALEHCTSPPAPLNVTGPERLDTRAVATRLGELLGRPVRFGEAGESCYLSDASRAAGLFGPPTVSPDLLIRWTADWLRRGGRSLDKPTHFEVGDGRF